MLSCCNDRNLSNPVLNAISLQIKDNKLLFTLSDGKFIEMSCAGLMVDFGNSSAVFNQGNKTVNLPYIYGGGQTLLSSLIGNYLTNCKDGIITTPTVVPPTPTPDSDALETIDFIYPPENSNTVTLSNMPDLNYSIEVYDNGIPVPENNYSIMGKRITFNYIFRNSVGAVYDRAITVHYTIKN